MVESFLSGGLHSTPFNIGISAQPFEMPLKHQIVSRGAILGFALYAPRHTILTGSRFITWVLKGHGVTAAASGE
jgi:hypothetical protein